MLYIQDPIDLELVDRLYNRAFNEHSEEMHT